MTFKINERSYTFRGTVTVVPADNLASHYLGGYKSPSGALRKCRRCMAVAEDMATQVIICLCMSIICMHKTKG